MKLHTKIAIAGLIAAGILIPSYLVYAGMKTGSQTQQSPHSLNRVVEVDASLLNAATSTPTGEWTNVLSGNDFLYITAPNNMGLVTAFQVLVNDTTLSEILGKPLYCQNGSSVVFKLIHASNGHYDIQTTGVGFVVKNNGKWFAQQYSYLPSSMNQPTLAEDNWPEMQSILLSLTLGEPTIQY